MLVVSILMPIISASLPKLSGRYTGSHSSLDGELKVYSDDTFDIQIVMDGEVMLDCADEERGSFLRKGQSNQLDIQEGCLIDALDEVWSELDEVTFDPKRRMIQVKFSTFMIPDITLDLMYSGEVEGETEITTNAPVTPMAKIVWTYGQVDREPTLCEVNQHVFWYECMSCSAGFTREAGDDPRGENTECTATSCEAYTSIWYDTKLQCIGLDKNCKYVKNSFMFGGSCSLHGCDAHHSNWADAKSQCEKWPGCKYFENETWWGGRCRFQG